MRISDWSSDVCSSDLAIPLLAETCPEHGRRGGGRSAYPWLDRILVVDVPVTVQHARLLQRDGIDAALADRMIADQATRRQRLAIADDVIVNDGALAALDDHVEAADRRYRTPAYVGATPPTADRKNAVQGKRVAVAVDLGGRRKP